MNMAEVPVHIVSFPAKTTNSSAPPVQLPYPIEQALRGEVGTTRLPSDLSKNSKVGLDHLNKLRISAGLETISPPWHNVYLADDLVASLEMPGVNLVDVEPFSATYYFLSRVVNAWLAIKEGKQPAYDAPVNQLALGLPSFGECAQGKLWVFERTNA